MPARSNESATKQSSAKRNQAEYCNACGVLPRATLSACDGSGDGGGDEGDVEGGGGEGEAEGGGDEGEAEGGGGDEGGGATGKQTRHVLGQYVRIASP